MDPMDLKAKEKQIELVLSEQPRVNLWKLRELALMEGGLVNGTYMYMQHVYSGLLARESESTAYIT